MGGKDVTPAVKLVVLLDCAAVPQKSNGSPQHGTFKVLAARHGLSEASVRLLWKQHSRHVRAALEAPVIDHAALLERLRPRRKMTCGRKPRPILPIQSAIAGLDSEQRATYRSASHYTGVPRSTLHRLVKAGLLKAAKTTIKPLLSEEHKVRRAEFCLNNLIPSYDPLSDTLSFQYPKFDNIIHVDEKIFRLDKIRRSILMAPWEDPPKRHAQSKRFLGQLMFFCAVAKPRRDTATNKWFDGKLGIWAFAKIVPAARSSKNRPRGTPVLTSLNVNTATYTKMLEEKLRPAILAKWPRDVRHVLVQQDNAPAHPAAGPWFSERGLTVELICQPAQSPDLNVLDLKYFTAIQSLQQEIRTKTLDKLVTAVEDSFKALKRETLENIFYTWCACMEQVMLCAGDNQYPIPHLMKEGLRRDAGCLPSNYVVSQEAATIAQLVLLQRDDSNSP